MTIRVAINGFGRIGRNILRAHYEGGAKHDIKIVAINDLGDAKTNAHLTRFDTAHGRFPGTVTVDGDAMVVNGDRIQVCAKRNPAELPWKELQVDVVLECTGFFTTKEKASAHIKGGAKKVKLTGIAKLDDANNAGTAKSVDCTLIITEGDSAKALAIAGLSVIGRNAFGVFPLRGKPRNVRDATVKQVTENEEFSNLKKILGLQHGKVYNSIKDLRYGRLMIMTDADLDGSHIKGLVLNMFHVYWPSLIGLGFVVSIVFNMPLPTMVLLQLWILLGFL
jgi:hypothetical protein